MDHTAFRIALGRVLRSHRIGLGLSQEAFAAEVGVHRTYVGSVERGERNVSIDNLLRLAGALAIRLSDLIGQAEESVRRAGR